MYIPALQNVHSLAPKPEYCPGIHLVHVVAEVAPKRLEKKPGLHWTHVEEKVAPDADEYVPALHKVQMEVEPQVVE